MVSRKGAVRGTIVGLLLVANLLTGAKAGWTETRSQPKISADAAVCMDRSTGETCFAKKPDKLVHPASITKIMTAIVVLEAATDGEIVTISPEAAKVYTGTIMKLRGGQIISLDDLVKAALMTSANDSTVALGMHLAGNQKLFVEMMNTKAMVLGLKNTNYVNTNGFSVPGHLTTAKEQVLLARYCLQNEDFAKIVSTKESAITITKNGKAQRLDIRNTNRFLRMYPGAAGVKTGTTTRAGNCLLGAATRNGKQLITIVLKSKDRYQDTIKLMEYGFNSTDH